MSPKKKQKQAAPATAVDATPYNPLRDRDLLDKAARKLAASLIKDGRSITAMTFCMEVLDSLQLREIAIGQAERIFISGVRKAALGAHDAELIIKPGPAEPLNLPTLDAVYNSIGAAPKSSAEIPDFSLKPHISELLTRAP